MQVNVGHAVAYPDVAFKTMTSPRGVVTFQSSSVCVDTLYPASSSIGMDNRFTILCSFSHTWKFLYQPFCLSSTDPAWQFPSIVDPSSSTFSRNSRTKNV